MDAEPGFDKDIYFHLCAVALPPRGYPLLAKYDDHLLLANGVRIYYQHNEWPDGGGVNKKLASIIIEIVSMTLAFGRFRTKLEERGVRLEERIVDEDQYQFDRAEDMHYEPRHRWQITMDDQVYCWILVSDAHRSVYFEFQDTSEPDSADTVEISTSMESDDAIWDALIHQITHSDFYRCMKRLRDERARLTDLIKAVFAQFPPGLRVDPGEYLTTEEWLTAQRDLLETHAALTPDGEAVNLLSAHFAQAI